MSETAGKLPAVLLFLVLGAVMNLLPLEIGTIGYLVDGGTLLALCFTRGGKLPVLQRVGAYLVGGGIAGILLLGSLVARIHNLCGGRAAAPIHLSAGQEYECYSIETLWALLVYAVFLSVGAVMLVLAWRRRTPGPSTKSTVGL